MEMTMQRIIKILVLKFYYFSSEGWWAPVYYKWASKVICRHLSICIWRQLGIQEVGGVKIGPAAALKCREC